MSITILYYKACLENINSDPHSEEIQQLTELLPAKKKKQINSLRHDSDRFLSTAGIRLFQLGAEKLGQQVELEKIAFPEKQKPSYPGSLDFNISHSGNIVCCAVSDQHQVGIDIERHRDVQALTIDRILGQNKPQGNDFFEAWTKIEAIIKAEGQSTIFHMKDIQLEEQGGYYRDKFWYCYPLEIEKQFTAHLATDAAELDICLEEITDLI